MKVVHLLILAILPVTIFASAQDWQHCKPDGSYSFAELKESVQRMTISHIEFSWDDKAFNRAGDLASLAIVQTLADKEMTSPGTLEEVLSIIRQAFACPSRCVAAPSDRQPTVTLLLLEHLRNNSSGPMQAKIDETRKLILEKADSAP